ncbi:MAG: Dabb family protein [Sulfuricella sp.]|nr:Dabb family protein [Sulfuricella sp.]
MIRHIVLWRLNGDTPEHKEQSARAIKTALEALNGKIPGLLRLEVGLDFSRGADSADIALYSEFESRAALHAYHDHPEHLKVVPLVKSARCERRIIDFEA